MRIEQLTLDEERALYGLSGAEVVGCTFDGPADGESALKECREISVRDCTFRLRYPLWHLTEGLVQACEMTETCRAPLWYGKRLTLQGIDCTGVKAVRECEWVTVDGCRFVSEEFGWKCRNLTVSDSEISGFYSFFDCRDLAATNLEFEGKDAFQYVENATLDFCTLRTKDAFWHTKNVTVTDSILEGEYLGWYSENLTLKHCVISGTQPFLGCKNLTLIDCVMEPSCDLAFERSEVNATLRGGITSVKNPLAGRIEADFITTLIEDAQAAPGSLCQIVERNKA